MNRMQVDTWWLILVSCIVGIIIRSLAIILLIYLKSIYRENLQPHYQGQESDRAHIIISKRPDF
jgi:hypothetical protein